MISLVLWQSSGSSEFIRRKASSVRGRPHGSHVHIRLGPVEVGEDKGRMVQGKGGAAAADPFSFFGLQVKQLVPTIKSKNSPLSGDSSRYISWAFSPYSPGLPQEPDFPGDWKWIRHNNEGYPRPGPFSDAHTASHRRGRSPPAPGGGIPSDPPARCTVSAAFIISHGDEALKAQLLCHSGSELYQTVIDLVDSRDPLNSIAPRPRTLLPFRSWRSVLCICFKRLLVLHISEFHRRTGHSFGIQIG